MPDDGAVITDMTPEQQLVIDGAAAIRELEEALAVAGLKLNAVIEANEAYRHAKAYARARSGVIKVDRCVRKVREMLDCADEETVGLHEAMAEAIDPGDAVALGGGDDK